MGLIMKQINVQTVLYVQHLFSSALSQALNSVSGNVISSVLSLPDDIYMHALTRFRFIAIKYAFSDCHEMLELSQECRQ